MTRPTKKELAETEEDFENGNFQFNYKKLKERGVSFTTLLLLRIWPKRAIFRLARELGYESELTEKAQALFSKVQRVDLVPFASGERGFQIILDKNTALYFYQNGDHFEYDGFETGEYDPGTVTIFDHLRH